MVWTLSFDRRFERDLARLDRAIQRRIVSFLEERVVGTDNPRALGAALSHELKGYWKYRVGDYRIICRFEEQDFVVIAIGVGHRSIVYDR